ncbi:RnfABCDGE type electron transport complex subunit D [candidate division KSB1 bacterium]|nr:RnfABCDGE type electron transport complex subunit D [candidate division KSB1 bacterium]
MSHPFTISPSPHVRDDDSIQRIMFSVILALLPAGFYAMYLFGPRVIWLNFIAIGAAVITEVLCQLVMKRPIRISDGSAILTGLLLAYNIPASTPLWMPAVGSIVGILVGKQVFGGIGYNPMNPALVGRAFLMASWPVHMTVFNIAPHGGTLSGIDAMTAATPLNAFKHIRSILLHADQYTTNEVAEASVTLSKLYGSYSNLFIGKVGGCIGETSALLLLIGAAFLMSRHIIGWKIPFMYVTTVFILTWVFGGVAGLFSGNPLFHILSGGLILGAFYMATDMVTTPVTFKGRILFGVGCGFFTVVIRLWGGYPEGVSYAILLMNLTTPLIDRLTKPKVFGG